MSVPTPAAVKKTLDEKRASGTTPPVAISSEKKFQRPERLTQRPFSSNEQMRKLRDSMDAPVRRTGGKPFRGTSKESTTKPTVRKDVKENTN